MLIAKKPKFILLNKEVKKIEKQIAIIKQIAPNTLLEIIKYRDIA